MGRAVSFSTCRGKGDWLAESSEHACPPFLDPALAAGPLPLYAASTRWAQADARAGDAWLLEAWLHPLAPGQPLPTLPLWLSEKLAVPLELEASYEETCRILRIG